MPGGIHVYKSRALANFDRSMETLHLFETASRERRPLKPEDSKKLRMYVCGPTVYGPAHIGNFRTFVLFDVLYRTLRAAGYEVDYVRNITDVDDKTIRGALDAGTDLDVFTQRWTDAFHEDCAALNLLPPTSEPKATAHIAEQISLVQKLMNKGHAYVGGDGSVYFKVSSFPDYGKLAHIDRDALQSQSQNSGGKRNLADEYDREAVADFALWKAHKPDDGPIGWDSPWGRGRPGWHLECSAMSMRYLGETFDLHGGGEDLCFPHHENEIAQSEGATGKPFVRHWMHCVHLLVEGRKMSKSLGNFFTLQDLVEKSYKPQAIRYALISGHYRQQLNFTLKGIDGAQSALTRIDKLNALFAGKFPEGADAWNTFLAAEPDPGKPAGRFADAWQALSDDLNTPAALGALFKVLPSFQNEPPVPDDFHGFRKLMFALGLRPATPRPTKNAATDIPSDIQKLAEERWTAKAGRDFARADSLREQIGQAGWKILDTKDGYTLQPEPES